MGKSKSNTKNEKETNKSIPKKKTEQESKAKLDEIDALFASRKAKKKANDENKDYEYHSKHSKQPNERSANKKILKGDRSDTNAIKRGEWVDDGLGGVFDKDGFTGRREQGSNFKIYKAHLMNRKGFGQSEDCPFDCDCCFI